MTQASQRHVRVNGIGPVEHLLAAVAVTGVRDLLVRVEGRPHDLPLLDGSAAPWARALRWLARPDDRPEPVMVRRGFSFRWTGSGGRFLLAHAGPRPRFVVDRWVKEAVETVSWSFGQEPFWLAARTFVTPEEVARGVGGGMPFDAARVVGEPLVNPCPLRCTIARRSGVDPRNAIWTGGAPRLPSECTAHKLLDLVGDLALACGGYLPCLIVHSRHAGHEAHLELGRALAG